LLLEGSVPSLQETVDEVRQVSQGQISDLTERLFHEKCSSLVVLGAASQEDVGVESVNWRRGEVHFRES
jgi:hypothetical protein